MTQAKLAIEVDGTTWILDAGTTSFDSATGRWSFVGSPIPQYEPPPDPPPQQETVQFSTNGTTHSWTATGNDDIGAYVEMNADEFYRQCESQFGKPMGAYIYVGGSQVPAVNSPWRVRQGDIYTW